MRNFEYFESRTVDEAISFLSEWGEKAKIIAGGTDILVRLKKGLVACDCLISIMSIDELTMLSETDGMLSIGSAVTLSTLLKTEITKGRYKLLRETTERIAGPQIRNMATLGGNLLQEVRCWFLHSGSHECLRRGYQKCTAPMNDNRYHAVLGAKGCFAVCPSDIAVALSALDANVVLERKSGERIMKLEELYGSHRHSISFDEILKRVIVPSPPAGSKQVFLKFAPRHADFATVSVAAVVVEERNICKDTRIALGALGPAPVRAKEAEEFLRGKPLSEQNAVKAAEIALKATSPLDYNTYKVDLAKTLIKRALLYQEENE